MGVIADTRTIKVLLVEDNLLDVALVREILDEDDVDLRIVLKHADRLAAAISFLGNNEFDIILLDLSLPDARGIDSIIQLRNYFSNIPIIVLTGQDDKTVALNAVRQGAQDYLVKGRFDSDLLFRSILYCIERQKLLNEIKILRGIIPICAGCKKIRDDTGYWDQVEVYISKHTDVAFTHGLCPDCASTILSDIEKLKVAG